MKTNSLLIKAIVTVLTLMAAPVSASHGNPFASTTLSPASQSGVAGSSFSVDIVFHDDPGSYAVEGIRAVVSFDPSILQATSVTGGGSPFGTVTINTIDNTTGLIEYKASGAAVNGFTITATTIVFDAIAPGTSNLGLFGVQEFIVGYGPYGIDGLSVGGSIEVTGAVSEFFTDPLTGPSSPDLEPIDGDYSYSAYGLERTTSDAGYDGFNSIDRPMVKTLSSEYLNTDFTAELTVTRTVTDGNGVKDLIYFGFGEGTANPNYFNEPTNAIIFRIHSSSGFYGVQAAYHSGVTTPVWSGANINTIGSFVPTGTTFRIEKSGNDVTLSIVGGGSHTYSVSDLGVLNASNSYIFFGNSAVGTIFTSLTVTPSTNESPVANAGADQSFDCILSTVDVILDGSGSSDPDSDPLTYSWSLGGTEVSTTASFTTSLGAGSHTFTLTVDDGNGETASDDVVIAMNADTDAPVLTLVGDNPIQTICHYGYTDPGVTVEDNCDTDPTVTMTTTVDTLTLGTYTVTYTATDASGNTASIERTVEVINNAPVVDNAVGGVTLEFGGLLTTTVDLSAVFSDPDGHAITFTVANSDAAFASSAISGSLLTLDAVDIGSSDITVTATDVCGASTDDVFMVTVNVVEDLAQTVVFASNSVQLKKEVDVSSGNIMVNNINSEEDDDDGDDEDEDDNDEEFELKMDKKVTVASGYAVKANRIQIKKDAEIDSDVYYNNLDNNGDINGNEYSPLSIPLFSSLPPFKSAPAGSQDITVDKNQSVDLTPGDYGKIKVKDNGTLTFSDGVYNVKSIKLKKKAKLRMDGDGTTEVRVEESLETGKDAYIGPANGSLVQTSDIIFYIAGGGSDDDDDNEVKFGKKGSVFATVYAPNSKIEVKEKTDVTGALYAHEVKVDKKANLTLDSFFDLSGSGGSAKQMAWSSEPEFEAVPTDFALNQNYPNPFNPSTTISYALSNEGFVSIKVYDILGREVASLVNRTQDAGRYQIRFEANNLSAGAYLYVLETPSFRSVKKMIYLK